MSENWTGSTFTDPRSRKIGTFTGQCSRQDAGFDEAIKSARERRRSWKEGFVPLPSHIVLTMNGGTIIFGRCIHEATSVDTKTGNVRLVLINSTKSRHSWSIVDISKEGSLTATAHKSPNG